MPKKKRAANGASTALVHAGDETSPPSGGAGAYLAIIALQEQRSKIATELAAIDAVIERLRK